MKSIFSKDVNEIAGIRGRSPMGASKSKLEKNAKIQDARDALKNAVLNAQKKYKKPADIATGVWVELKSLGYEVKKSKGA